MAGTSRVNREVYARFCGRLEVKSLRPTRQSSEQAQDFLSAHSFIYGHFHPPRHQLVAHAHHAIRSQLSKSGARRHAPNTQHDPRRWTTLGSMPPTRGLT
jgi:hypothetical protein